MAKSFFFDKFDPTDADNKRFIDDVGRLVEVPDLWPGLLAKIGSYVRVSSTPDKRQVVEEAAEAISAPAIDVAYHMRCLETLLAAFSENEDEHPGDLAEDFIELAHLPEKRRDALTRLFTQVQQKFDANPALIDEADARNGALPVLDLVRTTSELRGVFRRDRTGVERLREVVGMISVQLVFDTEKQTFFQLDRSLVKYLISELTSALRRLDVLEGREKLNTRDTSDIHITPAESRTA